MAAAVDTAELRELLAEHPVRIGLLFGSRAHGTERAESTIDIAVEFEESLSTEDRHRARIDLIVDLQEEFSMEDVDVVDLEGVRPSVGASATRNGMLLVGDEQRLEHYRAEFESQTRERSHADRMRELEAVIARLEPKV